jgi:hypothetical protein
MEKFKIGDRVKFNQNVAFAFHGLTGTIEGERKSVIDGTLFVVRLDTPTSPGGHFSKVETLGVGKNCLEFAF